MIPSMCQLVCTVRRTISCIHHNVTNRERLRKCDIVALLCNVLFIVQDFTSGSDEFIIMTADNIYIFL